MTAFKDHIINVGLQVLALAGVIVMPVRSLMLLVGFTVVLDLFFGIWCALKAGRKITSNKLARSVTKSIAYQGAILFGFTMDSVFSVEALVFSRTAAALIGLAEGKSISEHLEALTGINFWAFFSNIFQGLMERIRSAQNPDKGE